MKAWDGERRGGEREGGEERGEKKNSEDKAVKPLMKVKLVFE